MEEKPKIVVSRTRRADTAAHDFAFAESDLAPGGAALDSYRTRAFNAFKRLPLPPNTDEAWRRTDIHAMPADTFALPKPDASLDLPTVPEHLLKPLVADQHGGQVVLSPGSAKTNLDESLAKKGIIFTDKP